MKAPATLYVPSLRPYPDKIEPPTYPKHFEVRYVSRNNGMRCNRRWINVSATLREEHVGCEEVYDLQKTSFVLRAQSQRAAVTDVRPALEDRRAKHRRMFRR
jgi:hypothetical protein